MITTQNIFAWHIVLIIYSFIWILYRLDYAEESKTYSLGAARVLYILEAMLISLIPLFNVYWACRVAGMSAKEKKLLKSLSLNQTI